jgi:uncharacterized protein YktA (UPF0223 family)
MASNLPPGCASYDGIDHEFESAIEALVDRIKDARTAQMLINFLDAVEATYSAGYADGQMDKVWTHNAEVSGKSKEETSMSNDIYRANGYNDREHYLSCLAEDYGFDLNTVKVLADLLGPDEDFDGLVSQLEDMWWVEGRW